MPVNAAYGLQGDSIDDEKVDADADVCMHGPSCSLQACHW